MDHQFDKPASMDLPPLPEQSDNLASSESGGPSTTKEALPQAPERAATPPPAPASTTPQLPPAPASSLPPDPSAAATPASAAPVTTVPDSADDGDLIEKEWVIKAKQIVERTREDPHQQTTDMTIFKAGYMKKRYNKAIKLSE